MNYYKMDQPEWYPKIEEVSGLMEVEKNEA
jgi:hypothetical protein